MQNFEYVWAILTGTFTSLYAYIVDWNGTIAEIGVYPSFFKTLLIFLVITLWLSSGFAGATIAELRGKSRLFHFSFGLLLPLIYPLGAFFFMPSVYLKDQVQDTVEEEVQPEEPQDQIVEQDTKKLNEIPHVSHSQEELDQFRQTISMEAVKQDKQDEFRLEAAPVGENASPEENEEEEPIMDVEPLPPPPSGKIDQAYMSSISVDASGKHRGPFIIELHDGRFLEAVRILPPLQELAVLEIKGEGRTQTVRVPYAKIKSCELKSIW